MNKTLRALLARKSKLVTEARALTDLAAKEDRDLTADEQSTFDDLMAQAEAVGVQVSREERLIEAERSALGQPLEVRDGAQIEAGPAAIEQDARRGFRHFGEFAHAVRQSVVGHQTDERLVLMASLPANYGSEGVGADGGYAVPPEFAREIATLSLEQDALLPFTDNIPVSGNNMAFPVDETTPWGSDGVRAYWESEAGAANATKPKLGDPQVLRLRKLMALVPVTNELLSDAPAMAAYLSGLMGRSIRWKSNDAILNGSGVGQPLGIFNATALVSQAKEGSQTADTVVAGNVAKMLARLPATSMARARWVMNQEVLPQLITMTIGNQPIWTPPVEGIKGAPGGMLLGRPITFSESCAVLGDEKDIALIDFTMYRTITKAGAAAIDIASSMHLYFDQDATAFRATFRMDGSPSVNEKIAKKNGSSNELSPYVVLAART